MIAAIIVGAHLAVAVADRPPVVNFEQTCRDETTRDARAGDKFEHCLTDEKRARDQITAQWSLFDPGARTRCAREVTSGQAASYLELLVCLELEQADREVRGEGSTTGTITEPGRPAGERGQPTDPSRSRPAPSQPAPSQPAPSQAAPVAAPSRPAVPSSAQQSSARAAVAQPASPPPAAPAPVSPSPPASESQPTSQGEYLRQSLCRSPLGFVLGGC